MPSKDGELETVMELMDRYFVIVGSTIKCTGCRNSWDFLEDPHHIGPCPYVERRDTIRNRVGIPATIG